MDPGNLEKRFPCPTCGKSYKWRESLLKHRRIECGKSPAFVCEVCGNRFMHKHHLVKHRNAMHPTPQVVEPENTLASVDILGYP
jgi:transcription elongation factor Elf1